MTMNQTFISYICLEYRVENNKKLSKISSMELPWWVLCDVKLYIPTVLASVQWEVMLGGGGGCIMKISM